jgi:PST family polysaccharide transporter
MTRSASSYFETGTGSLRQKTLSGGIATGIGQVVTFALHFASIAILARLLSPHDFGLVAMVTAITGFVTLFGDSGLSMATVQRATITHEQVSTLFWINAGLGLTLMLVTMALGPIIAWFYGEPALTGVTIVTGIGFLFRGFGVQHAALLKRKLEFRRLITASVAGAAAGYCLGVIAAFQGLGYWSLVVQSIGTAAATTAAMWIACSWKPGPAVRNSGVKSMLGFGGALTGSSLLIHLLRNFDNLLIGWYWGSASLGFYSRGYTIMMMPMSQLNGPINQVAMPALSRVQSDPKRFREAYYKAVTLLAVVSFPACVLLAACAEPFIVTVLGEKWKDIVPLFIALAPAAVLSTLTNSVGWVYHSLGHAHRQLRWTLFAVPIYLGGFAIGLPFGPEAVAASFSITLSILFLPTFWFAFQGTPLKVSELLGVLWRPVTAALTAGGIVVLMLKAGSLTAQSAPLQLLTSGLVFAAVNVAVWFGLPGGKTQLLGTWNYLSQSFTRTSPAQPKIDPSFAGTKTAA